MKIHIPEFKAMAKCNEHLNHGPIDIDLGPDVILVVRCKDCIHRHSSEFCECRPEDAYCSDGERIKNPKDLPTGLKIEPLSKTK